MRSNNTYLNVNKFIVRSLYALLPLALLIIAILDINPSGTRTFSYSLTKPSAVISALFPEHRLENITSGTQRIKEQPVYFNVYYPHRYDHADVTIQAVNSDTLRWRVGLEVLGDTEWSYYLQEPDIDGHARFDLSYARVEDRHLRFMLAFDDLNDRSQFKVGRIEVSLHRKPFFSF